MFELVCGSHLDTILAICDSFFIDGQLERVLTAVTPLRPSSLNRTYQLWPLRRWLSSGNPTSLCPYWQPNVVHYTSVQHSTPYLLFSLWKPPLLIQFLEQRFRVKLGIPRINRLLNAVAQASKTSVITAKQKGIAQVLSQTEVLIKVKTNQKIFSINKPLATINMVLYELLLVT